MPGDKEAVVRRFFEAFASRDMQTIDELLSDDVVLHFSGRSPISGDFGKQRWFDLAARVRELTGGTLKADVHDVVGGDEHAVALLDMHAERDGRTLDWHRTVVYHVSAGKIAEAWVLEEDQYAVDEFFS